MKVTVIGLGFVGLPLVRELNQVGHNLIGIDNSREKIDFFETQQDFEDIAFSTDLHLAQESDAFVLALPTPIDSQSTPDLSALVQTCDNLGDFVNENQLVVIESTYPVSTTRNLLQPLLGKKIGAQSVKLVYSPERINPGDSVWNLKNTPKLVAAEDDFSKLKITELYGEVFDELVFVESYEIAESAKLLENIYRFININFINEFQQNCDALGLDASKVIAAASTKPFGFQAFSPSLGIGGHCIPIAPHHFMESLRNHKVSNGFIDYGNQINKIHLFRVIEKIERDYIDLSGKHVLVVGVTYKPKVPDTRESPAIALIRHLRERSIQVSWYDPLVSSLNGEERGALATGVDLALICVEQSDNVVSEILASTEFVLDISSGLDIRRLK